MATEKINNMQQYNHTLSVGTIFMLKCFSITTLEELKNHNLKVGDKPSYYGNVKVKQRHLDEINELLNR